MWRLGYLINGWTYGFSNFFHSHTSACLNWDENGVDSRRTHLNCPMWPLCTSTYVFVPLNTFHIVTYLNSPQADIIIWRGRTQLVIHGPNHRCSSMYLQSLVWPHLCVCRLHVTCYWQTFQQEHQKERHSSHISESTLAGADVRIDGCCRSCLCCKHLLPVL